MSSFRTSRSSVRASAPQQLSARKVDPPRWGVTEPEVTRASLGASVSRRLAHTPGRLAALVTLAAAGLSAAVAMVVNVVMARSLGPEVRGEVAWVLQVAYAVTPLLTCGVDRFLLRGSSVRSTAVWLVPAGVLTVIGLSVSALAQSGLLLLCIAIASVGAVTAVERSQGIVSRALWRYVLIHVAYQIWILVGSVTLAVTGARSPLAWLAVYAAPLLVLILLEGYSFVLGRRVKRGSVTGLRRDLKASLPLMIGGISTLIAARVERLILPFLASSTQLGLYVSIATASEMLSWAAKGLGDSRIRDMIDARTLSRGQMVRMLVSDSLRLLICAVPLVVAIKFALIPVLGAEFASANILVVPLCVTSLAWALYLQVSSIWLARAGSVRSMTLDATTAVVAAVCAAMLIPNYGALGAALGCAVAYALMVVVGVALLRDQSVEIANG